jgi:hypothetical protein
VIAISGDQVTVHEGDDELSAPLDAWPPAGRLDLLP